MSRQRFANIWSDAIERLQMPQVNVNNLITSLCAPHPSNTTVSCCAAVVGTIAARNGM
jgi:hypothetical protein